ncbi:MAG: ABC transporter permease [Tissierellia bacterium]|nr:ABC transporter permease [Tissierellia bacterium]
MNLIKDVISYYASNSSYVFSLFYRHFLMSVYGVLFAAIVAIPLGFFIARKRKLAPWVMGVANVMQTIPSLAMLSILMTVMGLGPNTVIMAVFLYSILPIVKNTYTGVINIDENIKDAAIGMGMTRLQLTTMVEFPLSISVIMAGLRNALVLGVSITTVGTFIGAGGLGDIITRGINVTGGSAIILAGALPTALMAILCDLFLGFLERKLDPTVR